MGEDETAGRLLRRRNTRAVTVWVWGRRSLLLWTDTGSWLRLQLEGGWRRARVCWGPALPAVARECSCARDRAVLPRSTLKDGFPDAWAPL